MTDKEKLEKLLTEFGVEFSAAATIELEIIKEFPCCSQEVMGFRKEATYIHLLEDVVKFVQQRVASLTGINTSRN